ncbi:uncharacterized protein V6R79_019518 [Siganus canaliculatus]
MSDTQSTDRGYAALTERKTRGQVELEAARQPGSQPQRSRDPFCEDRPRDPAEEERRARARSVLQGVAMDTKQRYPDYTLKKNIDM